MSGTREGLTRNWLIKAWRDLRSAEELSASDQPLLDTAAYHCQQAAEKSLKGFLVFHNVRFDKTHDIELLLAQTKDIDIDFSAFDATAGLLTPLATEFRYPGDFVEPDPDEFKEAYTAAEMLYRFVLERLPAEAQP